MKVYVYVDGFNLYYRALKGTAHKWVNLEELAKRILSPADQVVKIRYFTARVSSRAGDPDAPRRQQLYLNALASLPAVEIHYGRFLPKKKWRPLVATGRFVEIHDTEEKGSDVNLATRLLHDAWLGSYETALVFSQDTDLIEPIRIVAQELKIPVGLVWLDGKKPNPNLSAAASFTRHISSTDLSTSQFPNPIIKPDRTTISKPTTW